MRTRNLPDVSTRYTSVQPPFELWISSLKQVLSVSPIWVFPKNAESSFILKVKVRIISLFLRLKMKRVGILIFAVAMILSLPVSAVMQNSDWDKVLDRYEDICKQCITLREKIQAGETVSDRAVTSLLQELSQLRSTLQSASGSMTASQKERFNTIRDSYLGEQKTGEADNSQEKMVAETDNYFTEQPVTSKSTDYTDNTVIIRERNDSLISLLDEMVAHPYIPSTLAHAPDQISSENVSLTETFYVDNVMNGTPISRFRRDGIELNALTAYNREWSFGGMLVHRGDPLRSGYFGVLSNFSYLGHDYSCSSNGVIDGGGSFWGDGRFADNELFVTAGLTVWRNNTGNISAYMGTGYGINERLWRDISGKWAVVSDVSGRGLVLQGVAAIRFRKLSIIPNVIYMPSTNYVLPSIGLGYILL